VSAPITWEELARGVRIENFTMQNMPARVEALGDLWKPLLQSRGRVRLPVPGPAAQTGRTARRSR
jgi:bifunctional non-homologous end joining protein LigD